MFILWMPATSYLPSMTHMPDYGRGSGGRVVSPGGMKQARDQGRRASAWRTSWFASLRANAVLCRSRRILAVRGKSRRACIVYRFSRFIDAHTRFCYALLFAAHAHIFFYRVCVDGTAAEWIVTVNGRKYSPHAETELAAAISVDGRRRGGYRQPVSGSGEEG